MYLYLEKMMRMTRIWRTYLITNIITQGYMGTWALWEWRKGVVGEAVVAGLDFACVGWMGEESKTAMGRTKSILVGEEEMDL